MPEAGRSPAEKAAAVQRAVRSIPRGKVATYGDIAELAGCTARQVGWALRRSPPNAKLPWHRVLAAGGRIALPGESGLEQRMRLEAEGVKFSGRKVRLELCRWKPKSKFPRSL